MFISCEAIRMGNLENAIDDNYSPGIAIFDPVRRDVFVRVPDRPGVWKNIRTGELLRKNRDGVYPA